MLKYQSEKGVYEHICRYAKKPYIDKRIKSVNRKPIPKYILDNFEYCGKRFKNCVLLGYTDVSYLDDLFVWCEEDFKKWKRTRRYFIGCNFGDDGLYVDVTSVVKTDEEAVTLMNKAIKIYGSLEYLRKLVS